MKVLLLKDVLHLGQAGDIKEAKEGFARNFLFARGLAKPATAYAVLESQKLKKEREEVWNDIQKKERDGEIPEDDKFRFKDELQKLVDNAHERLEAMVERKEKEIIG